MNYFIFVVKSFDDKPNFFDKFYNFFDNATVSVIIGVLIASVIAIWQYKKQKEIDFLEERKKEVINKLLELKVKIKFIVGDLSGFSKVLNKFKNKSFKFNKKTEERILNNFFDKQDKIMNELSKSYLNVEEINNLIKCSFNYGTITTKYDEFYKNFLDWYVFIINFTHNNDSEERNLFVNSIYDFPEVNTLSLENFIADIINDIVKVKKLK